MRSKCHSPLGDPPSLCSRRPQSPSAPQKLVGIGVPAAAAARFPCPVCPQVVLLPRGLVAPRFSRFSRCFLVPWELRTFFWETHGIPRSVQGRGQAFSRFFWLYFPTEHMQEESSILPALVLDKAVFQISSQAGKCSCFPPWLVGKLRHSAGTREGPAEFTVDCHAESFPASGSVMVRKFGC